MNMKHTMLVAATALLAAGSVNAQSFSENFDGKTIANLQSQGWSFTGVPLNLSGDLVLPGAATATFTFAVTNTTPYYLVSFYASRALEDDTPFLDVTFRRTDAAGINLTNRFQTLPVGGGADPGGQLFSWHFGAPVDPGTYSVRFANGPGSIIPLNTSAVTLDTLSITAVPEPGTYALMLAGLGVVGFMARRRKSASAGPALPMGAVA